MQTRTSLQALKLAINTTKASPRTASENQMDVDRWTARTDEDHAEGVQGLLLLILEREGTALLNMAVNASQSHRFVIAVTIQARCLPLVKASRILAAIRRWARGPENRAALRQMGIALGEVRACGDSMSIYSEAH